MRGVNKVIVVGNLGNNPDQKVMANGTAVTTISVATSESWKDKTTGQQQERTEWHRVVFFNRLAEIAGEYLKKGASVYIEGQLRTNQWEKDGQKHYSTEIIASQMQMLGSREESQPSARPARQAVQPAVQQSAPDFNDDIPF